ncbi:centromere protein K isoform 2-T2 [Morus bassanus]
MAEYLPDNTSDAKLSADAKEELLNECESIWKQMEEYQSKLVRKETLLKPDHKLQKVKNDLEMMLTAVQSKNKQLKEHLEREQQWHEEQQHILDVLNRIEEERRPQVEELSKKSLNIRALKELENKMLKLKQYKEELLNCLGEFLEENFPPPGNGGISKKKNSSKELITLHEILEILINKSMSTPHEPYVIISDSFWPPYIELLLRYGIAMRHPEDPSRIRLEAFHM